MITGTMPVVHGRVSNSWCTDSTGIFIDLYTMSTQFRLCHLLYSFYTYMLNATRVSGMRDESVSSR